MIVKLPAAEKRKFGVFGLTGGQEAVEDISR